LQLLQLFILPILEEFQSFCKQLLFPTQRTVGKSATRGLPWLEGQHNANSYNFFTLFRMWESPLKSITERHHRKDKSFLSLSIVKNKNLLNFCVVQRFRFEHWLQTGHKHRRFFYCVEWFAPYSIQFSHCQPSGHSPSLAVLGWSEGWPSTPVTWAGLAID
jgi:hypothetical protein